MVPAKSASQAANGRNLTSYKHQARWGQLSAPHYHGGSRSELKLGKCWSALTDVIYIWRSLMGFLGGLKSRPWPLTFTFHRPDRGNCRQQVATILHTYTLFTDVLYSLCPLQIFHMCDEDGRRIPYMCANETSFNQKFRVCDWNYNVDCASSPDWWEI